MYRSLKVLVPAIQAAAAFIIFLLDKVYAVSAWSQYYLQNAKDLVIGMNLPVLLVLSAPLWPFAHSHFLREPTTPEKVVIGVFVLAGVSVFWYAVICELEMRGKGKSMLKFESLSLRATILFPVLCLAIGALYYAYAISAPIWYARPGDALVAGLFPAVWGLTFFGIAVSNLVDLIRKRRTFQKMPS